VYVADVFDDLLVFIFRQKFPTNKLHTTYI